MMVSLVVAAPVAGDPDPVRPAPSQFIADLQDGSAAGTGTAVTSGSAGSSATYHEDPVCEFGGAALCTQVAVCADGVTPMAEAWLEAPDGTVTELGYVCPENGEAPEPVQITNAMVARAFKRIPLPPSRLAVQPPDGETLVNFATNFYTEAEPFERSVTLVGQRVDLRIWPSSFTWSFGDGESTTTTEPGAAYPDLQVTHAYLVAGSVGPSVDTTYSAEFRVNGGPWEPVDGTVTMAGEPVGLQVRTARPTLVGYR
jgi:hypothetical protein